MRAIRLGFHTLCFLILVMAIFQVAHANTGHTASANSAATPEATPENHHETGNVDEVLKAIDARTASVDEKETALSEREKVLQKREQDLDEKIRKLEALRDSIRHDMDDQKKNNEERVLKLVSVMETMSPKSASGVLETIDDGLAVEVLKRIETKRMAKILNIMDKNRSAKLSELMTGYYNPNLVGQAGNRAAQRASRLPAQAQGSDSAKPAMPASAPTENSKAPAANSSASALDSKKGGTK